MRRFDRLVNRLAKTELSLSSIEFSLSQIEELENVDVKDFEQLKLLGLPLVKTNDKYATLNTRLTSLEEQIFCVVDIETSSSDVESGQIIEIGALLIKNGKEIDRLESLVYAREVPPAIEELTGIDAKQLENSPSLSSVLEKFRLFLKDHVFVAHNVGFDYRFISDSFMQCGYGPMLNRKLCTIDLAKKTIKSERYGLEHLREFLDLEKGEQHRAFWDAYNANEIFLKCLKNLPKDIFTSEELIRFSNPNPRKRKKKKPKKEAKTK
ncbi:MAG: DNA polymerase III subunit epsilon [Proteobacteria bacterium]|nr:MAG: DNA polymerase III subunit epsilon [Pseudomonadota bacterium]